MQTIDLVATTDKIMNLTADDIAFVLMPKVERFKARVYLRIRAQQLLNNSHICASAFVMHQRGNEIYEQIDALGD